MAIGFTHKHIEHIPLDNLTVEQCLSLATETSDMLGWVFGTINKTGFIAYTNNGLFAWNAEIKLKIENGAATLQSQSMGDDITDVMENKKNVSNFISSFMVLKDTLTPDELELKYESLKANFI